VTVTTGDDVMLVGALYHPPAPIYSETDLLDRIETHIEEISLDFPTAHIVLAGDSNTYVSLTVKMMLRQKNKLMRAGKLGRAESLAAKIRAAIIRYNSTELKRVDVTVDSRSMWAKVRQLTGKSKSSTMPGNHGGSAQQPLRCHLK